ncbi:hypothetical protein GCM10009551_066450 [Nocardiopsis tropica]
MDLTHVDHTGAARMVDVTGKDVTARTAVAGGVFRTTAEVIEKIAANAVAKGDVLATARIAGIMGVKRTPDLVPLCHPLPVSGVQVDLEPGDAEIAITATVRCTGRTGADRRRRRRTHPARHGQGDRPRRRPHRHPRPHQGGRQDRPVVAR